jgi:hypothetical protein
MIQIAALRSRLEKQPTDLRPYASSTRDDALAQESSSRSKERPFFDKIRSDECYFERKALE